MTDVRIVFDRDEEHVVVYQRMMPTVPAVGSLLHVMGYDLRVAGTEYRLLEHAGIWICFVVCKEVGDDDGG